MSISLIGGPLDGEISEGLPHLPLYMVATNRENQPVYKRVCCAKCSDSRVAVPYIFVGYQDDAKLELERAS